MHKRVKFMDKMSMRELHKSRQCPHVLYFALCLSSLKSTPNNTPLLCCTAELHQAHCARHFPVGKEGIGINGLQTFIVGI